MKMSPLCSLSSGLFLLFFVSPLQSDPQQMHWTNYPLPRPADHRSQPLEVFPDYYAAPSIQRSQSYATHYVPQDLPIYESSQFRSGSPRYPVKVPETYQQREGYYDYETYGLNNEEKQVDDTEISSREKEIVENMKVLDRLLSEDSDEVVDNSLDEKIMSEETKRVARQIRKQRPGFFWTLARVTFETINDTRSAFQQISDMINNNIAPDSATQGSMPRGSLTATVASTSSKNTSSTNETEAATTGPTSTTAAPFVLTRSSIQSLIRRNVLGLVKLFNLEWNEALNQSEINVRQFQKDLGKQVGTYLQDNPNAYR
ncbi:uncharacterized protein LOC143207157 [Lasioglossum baleicum]|uniref:uncharacterized protein LOC143207157 n=1 Tax=Lasioglossum baleicum TaxID=434251 RepID=UPI003FCC624B